MSYSMLHTIACLCLLACLYNCGSAEVKRRLCGRQLADILDLVCRGHYNLGKRSGRSLPVMLHDKDTSALDHRGNHINNDQTQPAHNDTFSARTQQGKGSSMNHHGLLNAIVNRDGTTSSKDDNNNVDSINNSYQRHRRNSGSRSIVDECCHRPCGLSTLETYCAPVPGRSQVRNIFSTLGTTLATESPTTTNRQTFRPRPSAHINRGNSINGSGQYFYVGLPFNQATRNPLLQKFSSSCVLNCMMQPIVTKLVCPKFEVEYV